MSLIYHPDSVENGSSLIMNNLPKPKTLNEIVSTIQRELLELIDDTDDRIALQRYFVENYAITN